MALFFSIMSRSSLPQDNAPSEQSRPKRAELVLQIADHHRLVQRHLLFWLQDQTYYRSRWHRMVTDLLLYDPGVVNALDVLITELDEVRGQYPYGFEPADNEAAQQLQGRLAILRYELNYLRDLCDVYLDRLAS